MNRTRPVVLVHGGLCAADGPDRFWHGPGVVAALAKLGYEVHTPQRPASPASWADEAEALAASIAPIGRPVAVVAASNGCSAALRLAVDQPASVDRLVLCWPATGDDPTLDADERRALAAAGVPAAAIDALLDGEVVRGVHPADLRSVGCPATLVPAEPEDPWHQRRTVALLRGLLPHAVIGLGTPPTPHPDFAGHLGVLVGLLDVVLTD